jgi:hypothetical protein
LFEDDDVYFDDEDDQRANTLNRLLNDEPANEFIRNADGEIQSIADKVEKKRKSK